MKLKEIKTIQDKPSLSIKL